MQIYRCMCDMFVSEIGEWCISHVTVYKRSPLAPLANLISHGLKPLTRRRSRLFPLDKSRLETRFRPCVAILFLLIPTSSYTYKLASAYPPIGRQEDSREISLKRCGHVAVHESVTNVKYAAVILTTVHRERCFARSERHCGPWLVTSRKRRGSLGVTTYQFSAPPS